MKKKLITVTVHILGFAMLLGMYKCVQPNKNAKVTEMNVSVVYIDGTTDSVHFTRNHEIDDQINIYLDEGCLGGSDGFYVWDIVCGVRKFEIISRKTRVVNRDSLVKATNSEDL